MLDHPLLAFLARGTGVCSDKRGTREVRGSAPRHTDVPCWPEVYFVIGNLFGRGVTSGVPAGGKKVSLPPLKAPGGARGAAGTCPPLQRSSPPCGSPEAAARPARCPRGTAAGGGVKHLPGRGGRRGLRASRPLPSSPLPSAFPLRN